jgi:S1-C subfamily serine protease
MALLLVSASACDLLDSAKPQPRAGPAPAAAPTTADPTRPAGNGIGAGALGSGLPSLHAAVDRVKPAVLQVVTEQAPSDLSRIFGGSGVQRGVGSGVLYDPFGHILTNAHVVQGAHTITVALADGRIFDARLVGTDPTTDIAVLHIRGDNLPVAPLGDSDQLRVGDWVVAIGNALGLPGGPTVTVGVVSAVGRTVQEPTTGGEPGAFLYDMIQTDAAINPGNSGGPLVNLRGEVIGINTLVAALAQAGVPAQGIGFAIAINTARPIGDQLLATGRVIHPYLGVVYEWVGAAGARQLRSDGSRGALVQGVQAGSPAAQVGLQRGDIITKVDGQPLTQEAELPKAIRKRRPGDSLQLTIVRDNAERTVVVTLGERPDQS